MSKQTRFFVGLPSNHVKKTRFSRVRIIRGVQRNILNNSYICWLIFNMTKSSKSSFSLVRPLYIITKQQTIRKSICLLEHELLLSLSCVTCVHRLNIFNLIIKYILYRSYLIGHYLLLITDVNVIITPRVPGLL